MKTCIFKPLKNATLKMIYRIYPTERLALMGLACVIARTIYSVLHFRICVLSHGRDRSTRGERNRTTLFTHELLSVRSIAHRNQQITTVSAEKKETATTTSRCRFTMRSIYRRRLRESSSDGYIRRGFYNRRGNTKFHHDGPADQSTR